MTRYAVLFIDGQYLSHIERYFKTNIDYASLAETIARKRGVRLGQTYYYTAPPFASARPTQDERSRKAGYDRFVHMLDTIGFIVREGRCQRIGSTYTQKGVDTLLTIDLIRMRQHHSRARTALLLTADTDFVPAIREAQQDAVEVVLIYAHERNRRSKLSLANALLSACPDRMRITESMIGHVRR